MPWPGTFAPVWHPPSPPVDPSSAAGARSTYWPRHGGPRRPASCRQVSGRTRRQARGACCHRHPLSRWGAPPRHLWVLGRAWSVGRCTVPAPSLTGRGRRRRADTDHEPRDRPVLTTAPPPVDRRGWHSSCMRRGAGSPTIPPMTVPSYPSAAIMHRSPANGAPGRSHSRTAGGARAANGATAPRPQCHVRPAARRWDNDWLRTKMVSVPSDGAPYAQRADEGPVRPLARRSARFHRGARPDRRDHQDGRRSLDPARLRPGPRALAFTATPRSS